MEGQRFYAIAAARIVAIVALLWFIFFMPGPWDWKRDAGTALVIAGAIGIAIAHYQLGSSFSVRAKAHHLVTQGIYSKIRNPIYFFGMLSIAGFVLASHRLRLWVILPIVIIVQIVRARREARVLEAAFGDEYRQYRRKTWF